MQWFFRPKRLYKNVRNSDGVLFDLFATFSICFTCWPFLHAVCRSHKAPQENSLAASMGENPQRVAAPCLQVLLHSNVFSNLGLFLCMSDPALHIEHS